MNSYNNNTKRQVLSLYSRIIRLSKSWTAKEPKNTCIEREYILSEARNEFRKNIFETDQLKIKQLLDEGNKRVGIALHYGIPYDRPEYLPPSTSYDVDLKSKTFKQRKSKSTPWDNVSPTTFSNKFGANSN
uniref:Complex 1 LYR protein domain-containing protein n=1 Tax=Meloidogyne enterolobii TaxID=390850 RepID=A0A6V7TP89_MELEN|nr:unnamed protein product [Meloidogyne enterolobii]